MKRRRSTILAVLPAPRVWVTSLVCLACAVLWLRSLLWCDAVYLRVGASGVGVLCCDGRLCLLAADVRDFQSLAVSRISYISAGTDSWRMMDQGDYTYPTWEHLGFLSHDIAVPGAIKGVGSECHSVSSGAIKGVGRGDQRGRE